MWSKLNVEMQYVSKKKKQKISRKWWNHTADLIETFKNYSDSNPGSWREHRVCGTSTIFRNYLLCICNSPQHGSGAPVTTTKSMPPPKGDNTALYLLTQYLEKVTQKIQVWRLHCGSKAFTADVCSWSMYMYTSSAFSPSINIKLGINISLHEQYYRNCPGQNAADLNKKRPKKFEHWEIKFYQLYF